MNRATRFILRMGLIAIVFVGSAVGGGLGYFHFAPPTQTCLSCHEMQMSHDLWAISAHKDVHCRECHGGSLTTNVHALREHANRVLVHVREKQVRPETIRLTEEQVIAVSQRCGACHASEYADWKQSGHAVAYPAIFLNEKQNRSELLNADCLRCHGMFFEGRTEDIVAPIDTKGPWKLARLELEKRPVMPCLSCHQVHGKVDTIADRHAGPTTQPVRPLEGPARVSLYSRREKAHFSAENLPVAQMVKDGRPVRVSPDPRQRLCVQCHAPNAFHQSGSSDDRTPTGVHEGLSCAACHRPHSNRAGDSCVTCHPRWSNCGLDVHVMDTTFRSRDSKHDIHFVDCGDCHQGRRPASRQSAAK